MDTHEKFFKGDLVAFIGSVFASLYVYVCTALKEDYPTWLGISIISLLSATY